MNADNFQLKISRTLLTTFLVLSGSANLFAADVTQGATALAIVPGKTTEIRIEMPDALRRMAGGGALSPVSGALIAIAVPENFDAARAWPILIVSATSDPGYNLSRRSMRGFVEPALTAGWVVLAADPAEPLAGVDDDTNVLRYALIKTALAALASAWPDSTRWPIAFGGFSGGSKRTGVLALVSTIEGRRPIGLFLGGCNEAAAVWALEEYRKPLPQFLRVPVFLSSGERDAIATPAQHRQVQRDMIGAGFSRVRLDSYSGRHELNQQQVRAALEWFAGVRDEMKD